MDQHEILAPFEIEAVDASRSADDGFAHGHGFQHLDVGAGGSHERRHHQSGAPVGGANIGDEAFERDARLREIAGDGVLLVPRAGDDVEPRVVEQGPYLVDEEFHRHDVGAVGEAADEEDAARVRGLGVGGGAEAVYIDAVSQRDGAGDGARGGHHAAVLFAHGDHAVHAAPGGDLEFAPQVEFATQFPAVVKSQKLLA